MTQMEGGAPRADRRGFLGWAVGGIAALFVALLGAPMVGSFVSVLWKQPPEKVWVRVCSLDQIGSDRPAQFPIAFPRNDAARPFEDLRAVFVIRRAGELLAFTNVCTHMGCSVRWLDWRQQILCPCHGGVYDRWGDLAGGPPPHRLPIYVHRVEGNYLYVANRFVEGNWEA